MLVWMAQEMRALGRAAEVKQAAGTLRAAQIALQWIPLSWEKQEQLGQQKRKTRCMG